MSIVDLRILLYALKDKSQFKSKIQLSHLMYLKLIGYKYFLKINVSLVRRILNIISDILNYDSNGKIFR
jgi:hypothetical protein